MHKTDISVICPLYHGRKYIDSILEMLYRNQEKLAEAGMPKVTEVIFVNDYPQEKISLPQSQREDLKLKLLEPGTNQGIHRSRVLGVEQAEGEYILFLDQDDRIREDFLKSQLSHMDGNAAVLCNGYYQNSRIIYSSREEQENAVYLSEYLKQKNVIISPGQVLLRTESIPEEWKHNCLCQNGSDDVLLWILMLVRNKKFALNEEKLFWHMESDSNASYQFEKMQSSIRELLARVLGLDCLSAEQREIFRGATERRLARYDGYVGLQRAIETLADGKNLSRLREYIGSKRVAVYGWGILGREFWKLAHKAGVAICFGIDSGKAAFMKPEIPLYNPREDLPKADIIIVTPVTGFQEIKAFLEGKCRAEIVSLSAFLERIGT